jgi:hypothetical protein
VEKKKIYNMLGKLPSFREMDLKVCIGLKRSVADSDCDPVPEENIEV